MEWNINSSLGLCPTDLKFASPNNHMSWFLKINPSFYPQTSFWFCFPGEPLLTEVSMLLFACACLWLNLDHAMISSSMLAPYPFSTSGAALLLLIDLRLHTCFFSRIDISSPVILAFSHHPSTPFWLTPLSFPPSLSFHSPLFQSLSCPKFQFPYRCPFAPTALAVVVVQSLSCVWLFGDGQGGLAWCSSWSRKGLETERLNWTERKYMSSEGGLGDKGFEWKAKGLKFIFQASAFQEFWSSETLSFFPLKIILAEVQYIKWIQYIKYIRFAWFESPWWRWWRSEEL